VQSTPNFHLCEKLINCLNDLARKRNECEAGKTTPQSTGSGSRKCSADSSDPQVKLLEDQLDEKKQQQSQQFNQCINDRKNQSFDVTLMGNSVRINKYLFKVVFMPIYKK